MPTYVLIGLLRFLFLLPDAGSTKNLASSPLKIQFNSFAYLNIQFSEVPKQFELELEYYPNLTGEVVETVPVSITSDTSVVIQLRANMPEKHTIKLAGFLFPAFVTLNDTLLLSLNLEDHTVGYKGKYKAVNEYYYSSARVKDSNFQETMQLVNAGRGAWTSIYAQLDSMEDLELNLLTQHSETLPEWFIPYERQKIKFFFAHFKASGPNYRNFIQDEYSPRMSADQFDFVKKLDLNDPVNQYLESYYHFLNFYAFYKIYGSRYVYHDSVTQLFNDPALATRMFEVFDDIPKENFLAFATDNTLMDVKKNGPRLQPRMQYLRDKYGKENKFVNYLIERSKEYIAKALLPGDKAPIFTLTSTKGNLVSLDELKGKLILLNFYIRGCKPCFKEVPFEKELAKLFGDHNFEILNICVTNDPVEFTKALQKFKMEEINLYAQGNWTKLLIDKYLISGYPHYCLLDRQGNVIMNNAFKPSDPKLTELIESNL